MFSRKIKGILLSTLVVFASSQAFSEPSFTGIAGGKLKITPDQWVPTQPDMTLQAFFSGQVNFSQNAWGHMEFSLDTDNLISENLFDFTDARFQIDELSLTLRHNIESINNYFSIFIGTYDPIGSDIFLQRQFGISSISSKITESWLGMAGSLLYPHFGIGVSDVLRFSSPFAAGLYTYVNSEDSGYVFNTDVRFGGTKRFFTFDIAAGLNAPMVTKQYDNLVLAVERLNWHAGTTMLLGNNYTPSLFIQAGVYNAIFKSTEESDFDWNELYFLVEPRIIYKGIKIHTSVFCLPENTVTQKLPGKTIKKLLFVNDQMGLCFNFFTDTMNTRNTGLDFGMNTAFTINDLQLGQIKNVPAYILAGNFDIQITPYISSKIMNGEVHSMLSFNVMDFFQTNWVKSLQLNVSYKTSF